MDWYRLLTRRAVLVFAALVLIGLISCAGVGFWSPLHRPVLGAVSVTGRDYSNVSSQIGTATSSTWYGIRHIPALLPCGGIHLDEGLPVSLRIDADPGNEGQSFREAAVCSGRQSGSKLEIPAFEI